MSTGPERDQRPWAVPGTLRVSHPHSGWQRPGWDSKRQRGFLRAHEDPDTTLPVSNTHALQSLQ